ncbi:MAG: hypothetical protein ACFFDN_10050 [Candidatus Hodarchaeota archaeon]
MRKCDGCFQPFPEEELHNYMGKYLCDKCRSTCQVCKKQYKLSKMSILSSSNPMLEGVVVYCKKCYHKILRYIRCPKCESDNITMTVNGNIMEIRCKDCFFKKDLKI